MLKIRRGISFILIAAFISGLLSGCGKTKNSSSDYNEKGDEAAEVSTETSQEHDFWKLNSKAEDHRLTLMFQHLEAPGTAGKYYNRIAVTGGDNEPVKSIINNSMQDLDNQAARCDGYSYASVLRNDDILLSYQCGYVEDNYKHVLKGIFQPLFTKELQIHAYFDLSLSFPLGWSLPPSPLP